MSLYIGFVTGYGRSGTMWLAKTLREAAGVPAQHEPRPRLQYRPPVVVVDSHLRFQVNDLRKTYPRSPLWILVRDGRDVIRSAMTRMLNPDPSRMQRYGFETFAEWVEDWAKWNRYLTSILHLPYVRAEDLWSSFDVFEGLAMSLAPYVSVNRHQWDRLKNQKQNVTKEYRFPAYEDWTDENRDLFWHIAGDTMKYLGYARET